MAFMMIKAYFLQVFVAFAAFQSPTVGIGTTQVREVQVVESTL